MELSDREKIRYVKNALNDYYFIMGVAVSKFIEVISLEEQYGNDQPAINEEIKQLNRAIDAYLIKTVKVEEFLSRLNTEDRVIIYNLHKKRGRRKQYGTYCHEVGMSKSTLQRHVDKLILEYWHF